MRVVAEKPPIYDEADRIFAIAGRPVIFAWGTIIYNPHGADVTPELLAHEVVHGERQGRTEELIHAWWRSYFDDTQFRFNEEVLAHRAEYKRRKERCKDRNALTRYLVGISMRLSSPLYGSLVSQPQAMKLILNRS